jgi:anti-sigma factor RsiW
MRVRDVSSLTCKEVVELVSEYLEGGLAPDDRARLEQHLFVCPPCTLHFGQVRATIAAVGELRSAPADEGRIAAALDQFRKWKRG